MRRTEKEITGRVAIDAIIRYPSVIEFI